MTPRTQPCAQIGDVYRTVKADGQPLVRVVYIVNDGTWDPFVYTLQRESGQLSVAAGWMDDERNFIRVDNSAWHDRLTRQLNMFEEIP